jgi:hypothetical protein
MSKYLFIILSMTFGLNAKANMKVCMDNIDFNTARTGYACLKNACAEGLKMGKKNATLRENQIYTNKSYNQNNCYKKIYDPFSRCNRKMIFNSNLYQNKMKNIAYHQCLKGLRLGSQKN